PGPAGPFPEPHGTPAADLSRHAGDVSGGLKLQKLHGLGRLRHSFLADSKGHESASGCQTPAIRRRVPEEACLLWSAADAPGTRVSGCGRERREERRALESDAIA